VKPRIQCVDAPAGGRGRPGHLRRSGHAVRRIGSDPRGRRRPAVARGRGSLRTRASAGERRGRAERRPAAVRDAAGAVHRVEVQSPGRPWSWPRPPAPSAPPGC